MEGWCDRCNKKTEKLLQCGRCKQQVYCSRKCQEDAWPTHKGICKRPEKPRPPSPPPAPKPEKKPASTEASAGYPKPKKEELSDDALEHLESAKEFRSKMLSVAAGWNSRMVECMQSANADLDKYLKPLGDLKEDYEKEILDRYRAQQRVVAKQRAGKEQPNEPTQDQEENVPLQALNFSKDCMREVIMAVLQRGVPEVVKMHQLDLGNNFFDVPVVERRPPQAFALPKDQIEGFDDATQRVCGGGFCCVDGLLDDSTAENLHKDFMNRHWKNRGLGALKPTPDSKDGFGYWLPFPPRPGYDPYLKELLTILFGLPMEFVRAGYPRKLSVPTQVYISCLPPGATEPLHLDSERSPKREITMVMFVNSGWSESDGGAFKAYLKKGACDPEAGARLRKEHDDSSGVAVAETPKNDDTENMEEEKSEESDSEKDRNGWTFEPEAGRCLIFRSKECWHEIPAAKRMSLMMTLWVDHAE